jgi:hypothetical protein
VWRIVESKKGDCASIELSHLLMRTTVDLYNIGLVPIRDLIYIPTSANVRFLFSATASPTSRTLTMVRRRQTSREF